jgi:ferredoxin
LRHEMLLDALTSVPERVRDLDPVLPPSAPLTAIHIDALCDGCGLCALYCPHGALALTNGGIRADQRSCTACGLCAEVCPASAISLVPAHLVQYLASTP